MSEKPKHFKGFLIALSALTIIEYLLLKCIFTDDPAIFFMATIFFFVPFILLWLFNIYIVFKCFRMRNIWERCFIAWVAILLLLMPISFKINERHEDNNYLSSFIKLPDGDTLTITSDKVIFGKCDSLKNIQKDYIDLRYECHNYSITLTQDDTLYIWTENDSLPAKTHELRYPVGKIYADYRKDEYNNVIIKKKMKWMFEYDFMYDGIHTGGSQTLIHIVGDSLHEKMWCNYSPIHIGKREFRQERTTTLKEYFKYSIPVDSLFD